MALGKTRRKAQFIIWAIAVVCVALSVTTWFPNPEPNHGVRLVLLLLLAAFTAAGKNWARIIFAVLTAIAGSMALLALFAVELAGETGLTLLVPMAVVYLVSSALLTRHPDIRALCGT